MARIDLVITDVTYRAIREKALNDWSDDGAYRLPDGRWRMVLSTDTIDRLDKARRLKNETYDDIILRLASRLQ